MTLSPYERELLVEAQAALPDQFFVLKSRISDLLHGASEPHDQPGLSQDGLVLEQYGAGHAWLRRAS